MLLHREGSKLMNDGQTTDNEDRITTRERSQSTILRKPQLNCGHFQNLKLHYELNSLIMNSYMNHKGNL